MASSSLSHDSDQVVDNCLAELGGDAESADLFRCVAGFYNADLGNRLWASNRNLLLVYSTALVFFMQAGFAMLCAGSVRKKNTANSMLKNLLDACGASLAFFVVGYAFAFGGEDLESSKKTFIGTSNFFLMDVDDHAFWLFQYAFSAASATIVAGTLAERCQMAAYLAYSLVMGALVYPVIAHSIWSAQGFLSAHSIAPLWGMGVVDFAGSGVVHMTGGLTALFATTILGPRRGRFHDSEGRPLKTPKEFPGHSVALQMLGTFILWFGWYGFNAGSALTIRTLNAATVLPLSGVNTTLAGGTGGIIALFVNLFLMERNTGEAYFDLKYLMNGALSGLAAITGSCGVVELWAGVVIGGVSGLLYIFGSWALLKFRLDDVVDGIPIHMLNGAWGLLAAGLFASPDRLEAVYGHATHVGLFYDFSDWTLLGLQCCGILFIFGWIMFTMFPFFIWLDYKGWFRADPLDEIIGLDTSYHGGCVLGHNTDKVGPDIISELAFKGIGSSPSQAPEGTLDVSRSLGEIEEEDSNYFDT